MLVGILSILAAAGLTLVDQLIKLWATVELLPVGSKPLYPACAGILLPAQ